MIIPEDIKIEIETFVSEYIDKNKDLVSDDYYYRIIQNSPIIKNELLDKIITTIDTKDGDLQLSTKHYLNKYINDIINNIVNDYFNRKLNKLNIVNKLLKLKKLELPEQRSPEWYKIRTTLLTASSLADALGKGHFNTKEDLLIDKTSTTPKPYFTNDIIEWGVKYEPVATTFYEKLNNVNILEFGLVPHPEFKIFGASPDGICDENSPEKYIGRMLEIKCPPVRKFTKEVPEHYWMQMQGQLETCDLEECDFLQVKLKEYNNEEEYIKDQLIENQIVKEGYTKNNFPKGLILTFISFENDVKKYNYKYSNFYESFENLKKWSQETINNYNLDYSEIKHNWWYIERYECTIVYRDRNWWLETMPKIIDFWEDVEHYREIGNQSLIDKKQERKKKRKKKKESDKNVITINKEITNQIETSYLLEDSDTE